VRRFVIRLGQAFFERWRTPAKPALRPRMEEVRGSSPLGFTPENRRFAGKTQRSYDASACIRGVIRQQPTTGLPTLTVLWPGGICCLHGGPGSKRACPMAPATSPDAGCRQSCRLLRSSHRASLPSMLRHVHQTSERSKQPRSGAPRSHRLGSGTSRRAGVASRGGYTHRRAFPGRQVARLFAGALPAWPRSGNYRRPRSGPSGGR
jgi:hypothetical protein